MTKVMRRAVGVLLPAALLAVLMTPAPAQARCINVTQSHNGTDMFYADGAAGTAAYKIRASVEAWQKKSGVKKVRIGKISTKCGNWFMKYGLPHRTCTARARVCW